MDLHGLSGHRSSEKEPSALNPDIRKLNWIERFRISWMTNRQNLLFPHAQSASVSRREDELLSASGG